MQNQAEGLTRGSPNVISTASGKGGVGKTIAAVNLSVILAKRSYKVLLFDVDAGFANAEILLGITPTRTLKDFFQRKEPLESIICKTRYGVDLISSGMDVDDLIMFNIEDKTNLYNHLQRISSSYDYIVFDFPPGFKENIERFYGSSDHLVLLTASEPTSLINAYTFVKVMAVKGIDPEGLHIVMNMITNMKEGRRILDRFVSVINRFVGTQVSSTHLMRYDNTVKKSVDKQKPFAASDHLIQPTLSLHRLADEITKSHSTPKMSFIDKIRSLFGLR